MTYKIPQGPMITADELRYGVPVSDLAAKDQDMFLKPGEGVHSSLSIYKDAQRLDLFKNFLVDPSPRMATGLTW
jgi:hypothetical protein